jgi:glycerate 2-kinase
VRVVVAPDAYKGTLDAPAAAAAVASAWLEARPGDEVLIRPMADGGEGTMAAVHAARGGRIVDVGPVTGPVGTPASAPGRVLMLPEGTGVVELATCAGLPLLAHPAPLTATTRGLGETCARALDLGIGRLVVALGGSASTDGGAGLLTGLGARLRDRSGADVPPGGAALAHLDYLDLTCLRPPPPHGVEVLVDVAAPLLGPAGAAAVFAPQKGATGADVIALEAGLTRWAAVLGGRPEAPGSGAAGGTGYALAAAWSGRLTSGSAAVADLTGLDAALDGADLLVTGEGRLDATSWRGKVVGELVTRAAARGVDVLALPGQAGPDAIADAPAGVQVETLAGHAGSLDAARADPVRALRYAVAHWLAGSAAPDTRLKKIAVPAARRSGS